MKFTIWTALLLLFLPLWGSRLYKSDGSYSEIVRAEGLNASKIIGVELRSPVEALFEFRVGEKRYSISESERGALPVYFLGNFPAVADDTLFWSGEGDFKVIEKRYSLKLAEIMSSYGFYKFKVVDGDSVKISQEIVENGDGFAFPNLIREAVLKYTPQDPSLNPLYSKQWHLSNGGKYDGTGYSNGDRVYTLVNADIKFEDSVNMLLSKGIDVDDSTTVAIMDSGVSPDHPDLQNQLDGFNVLTGEENGHAVIDDIDKVEAWERGGITHGTNCAGTAAAEGNEIGSSGVCPWCDIYPVRMMDGLVGSAIDDAAMLEAFQRYVDNPNIVAVNCSFGPPSGYGNIPSTSGELEAHKNFLQNGRDGKGGVIVYASGNDNVDSSYHLLQDKTFTFNRNDTEVTAEIVSVSASSAWDTKITYSNYGEGIDIAAPTLSDYPSVGIVTTTIPGYGNLDDDYMDNFSGTSASAPIVTGFFGFIFSINSELTHEEAVEIMKNSADKINPDTGLYDSEGHSVKFGFGRLNLLKASRLAAGLPMCEEVLDEVCGNHIDDNCDGWVDEGCTPGYKTGEACIKDSDCLYEGAEPEQVGCVFEVGDAPVAEGYCVARVTDQAPCHDGSTFDDSSLENECLKECNNDNPCARDGFTCSDRILGFCVPKCDSDDDCLEGSYCTWNNTCRKSPSEIGGFCDTSEDCLNNGICITNFSDGYCTSFCDSGSDYECSGDSKCVERASTSGYVSNLCLKSCERDSDCREGDDFYVCHPNLSGKNNLCYRRCEEDIDCRDFDATCNEEGYCAPSDWQGWDASEVTDEDSEEADADIEEETEDETLDEEETTDTDKKEAGGGCSIII
jgi:subtilisin family serine protease